MFEHVLACVLERLSGTKGMESATENEKKKKKEKNNVDREYFIIRTYSDTIFSSALSCSSQQIREHNGIQLRDD